MHTPTPHVCYCRSPTSSPGWLTKPRLATDSAPLPSPPPHTLILSPGLLSLLYSHLDYSHSYTLTWITLTLILSPGLLPLPPPRHNHTHAHTHMHACISAPHMVSPAPHMVPPAPHMASPAPPPAAACCMQQVCAASMQPILSCRLTHPCVRMAGHQLLRGTRVHSLGVIHAHLPLPGRCVVQPPAHHCLLTGQSRQQTLLVTARLSCLADLVVG